MDEEQLLESASVTHQYPPVLGRGTMPSKMAQNKTRRECSSQLTVSKLAFDPAKSKITSSRSRFLNHDFSMKAFDKHAPALPGLDRNPSKKSIRSRPQSDLKTL
jgi:hypothetical protein